MRAGVLNVNKPEGAPSFTVVKRLRDLTGARRVGHAGTLDPLATGVLPILFESATRLTDYAPRLPKAYEADVHLGATTDTDDAEGERHPVGDPAGVTETDLRSALAGFVGRIWQEPPALSAVKIGGERSYKRARQGDLERPAARQVEVYEAELLSFEPGPQAVARIRVVCGSGTYLRSLARDVGAALQVGGYLGKLVRTAYGPLAIAGAARLDDLVSAESVDERLLPAEVILPDMQAVRLTVVQEALVRQGRPVRVLPEPAPGPLRAHGPTGRLVALGHTDPLKRTFVPEKVLV